MRRSVTVVGRLPRSAFATSEVWIHPNGKVAYLGTHMGGDRVYAIDISEPGKPGSRRLDHGEHPARERHADDAPTATTWSSPARAPPTARTASSSPTLHDPLHPKEISQFTDGVAAGVHSVYIYEHPKYGGSSTSPTTAPARSTS